MSRARYSLRRIAVVSFLLFAAAQLCLGEEDLASRVLVVNAGSGESKRVAEYYMRKRGIPRENRCEIHTGGQKPDTDLLYWDQYESKVAEPIRKCLTRVGKDRILYIVFSFKVPYRLWKVPPHHGVALDAYVADIWGETAGSTQSLNPYFDPAPPHVGNYAAFVSLAEYRAQPNAKHIYSVWRLDGATEELARGLVDKAMEAEKTGLSGEACIDRRMGAMDKVNAGGYGMGDWDLHRAAEQLRAVGVNVIEDENEAEFGHSPAPEHCDNAIFYAGWYSLNHYNDAFTWKPGAIGIHLDSASAADPRKGPNWSASAVMKGITVTSGAVDEPTLSGLPHPGGIVHDLLGGANVGDAFLRNTFWLRWMIMNIGDPLYRPKFLPSKKADEPAPAVTTPQK